MPITPNGTAWTKRTATLPGIGVTVFSCPDDVLATSATPTVLFFHGAGGLPGQLSELPAFVPMFAMLMDNGIAVIEGDPLPIIRTDTGASMSGQQWCNAQSRAAYPAFHQYWAALHPAARTVEFLMGRSMGGLMALYLAAKHPDYAGAAVISNSGVSSWFIGDNSPVVGSQPPTDQRSTGRYFTPAVVNGAWGVTSFEELREAVDEADVAPESWNAEIFAGRSIAFQYGDADRAVPWQTRGGAYVRNRWAPHLALDRVALQPGGTHDGKDGTPTSYQQVDAVRDFILEVLGQEPPPPQPATINRVVGRYTRIDGNLHRIL
ncbi:alpha/beta hydrolase-fold protein [Agromyces atrinae]|uniref:alpha/beta hydrolase n=1 Tax=Agromyces atrinae TaxID=592376 RepID=UPI001F597245|nr:alpha/beta hydrolase-fold protein [Agromyces atrinae]MCI2958264.1 alpha/beta hydrolase-fold protein [Agromyces atrinae]